MEANRRGRTGRRGGAGATGGFDFQARLAAWFACTILAETDAAPLWGWPEAETFESVYAETGEEVDDLLVGNSAGSCAYVQAKLRLNLGKAIGSEFASTIGQFVKQYLAASGEGRPFTRADRLVLALGPDSSNKLRAELPRVLVRLRGLPKDERIETAAKNSREADVLSAVISHAKAAWKAETGAETSDAELRDFLSCLWVSVHDLADGGRATREAQEYLRRTVLSDATAAGQVWRTIVSLTARFSADQTGADRLRLQELLETEAVSLKSAPSYREDIERLIEYSKQTAHRLESLSKVSPPGGAEFKIARHVPDELVDAIRASSPLVTGDPGAGKSASVFELVGKLRASGRDVVVLAADALSAESLGKLRDELSLDHEVVDVLRNWPGTEPAVLLVDALDAARGDRTQQALLDLIAATSVTAHRWRVVASIRRFDLRYNQKLRDLFPADPTSPVPDAHSSDEFELVRHFVVPLLSDDELEQLASLSPELHAVVAGAPADLRKLVRVPFNLRLLAELVALNVAAAELEPIVTQVQLLDKYWEHRVLKSASGADAREAVLRQVLNEMIEMRATQINRRSVSAIESDAPLKELLSEQVLSEQAGPAGTIEREVLTFSHHVLFDYAVARLLFRGTERTVPDAVVGRPELLLIVRPSFDLHFRYLWELEPDHARFWTLVFNLASRAEVPQIGRIIGPGVAAEMLRNADDVASVLEELRATDEQRRRSAEEILRHLIGTVVTTEPKAYLRSDAQRSAWCEFARELGDLGLRAEIAFPLRQLLWALADDVEELDAAERSNVGSAARGLLRFALEQEHSNRALMKPAITAVAATFASDPEASSQVFRRLLERERLEKFGFQEMPDLAEEVEKLIKENAVLVRDIYIVTFEFEETSEDKTAMGGIVLPLTSNRRQDYGHAHYRLAEAYPAFLQAAPREALAALASIRLAYNRRQTSGDGRDAEVLSVEWDLERTARIVADGSSIWDEQPFEHDDEVKVLNAFETRLGEIAEDDPEELGNFIDLLVGPEVPASVWRRLLMAASRKPETFAPRIAPLCTSPEVLAFRDLSTPLGDFLKAGFAHLVNGARAGLERNVVGLPDYYEANRSQLGDRAREFGEDNRDRLLGCLDPDALVTDEAKSRLEELTAAGEVPENRPPISFSGWRASEYGEREELAERGVDVDSESNQRLRMLEVPVKELAEKHRNGRPAPEEINAMEEPLRRLWDALLTAEDDGADEEQRDYAWGYAAEVAEAISRGTNLSCESAPVALAREILLKAADHSQPSRTSGSDEQFEEHPMWGFPAPRVEAAGGLLNLALHEDCVTQELLASIEKLSDDPVPVVRMHVARGLYLLRLTAPDLMWDIAKRIAEREESRAVTTNLVTILARIVNRDEARLREVTKAIYARTDPDKPGGGELRNRCVDLLTGQHVWRGDEGARDFLDEEVLGHLDKRADAARHMVLQLRDSITHGNQSDQHASVRKRSIKLMSDTLSRAGEELRVASDALKGRADLTEDDPDVKRARGIAGLIDAVGMEVYFASGAFDDKQNKDSRITREQRERLYREAGDVLDQLADVPLAPVTHHLIETLEVFIEFDARGVFIRLGRAIRGGKAGDYQFDSMAIDLFVRVVERYLAEHRTLIQQDEEVRELLIEMLDVFVEAGWPKARQLTYGLHELFR